MSFAPVHASAPYRQPIWDELRYPCSKHHVFVIVHTRYTDTYLGPLQADRLWAQSGGIRRSRSANPVRHWVHEISQAAVFDWDEAMVMGLPNDGAWMALGVRIYLTRDAPERAYRAPRINRRTHIDYNHRGQPWKREKLHPDAHRNRKGKFKWK